MNSGSFLLYFKIWHPSPFVWSRHENFPVAMLARQLRRNGWRFGASFFLSRRRANRESFFFVFSFRHDQSLPICRVFLSEFGFTFNFVSEFVKNETNSFILNCHMVGWLHQRSTMYLFRIYRIGGPRKKPPRQFCQIKFRPCSDVKDNNWTSTHFNLYGSIYLIYAIIMLKFRLTSNLCFTVRW